MYHHVALPHPAIGVLPLVQLVLLVRVTITLHIEAQGGHIVLGCPHEQPTPVCIGVCWCVLVCVGVCWCVLVCVDIYYIILHINTCVRFVYTHVHVYICSIRLQCSSSLSTLPYNPPPPPPHHPIHAPNNHLAPPPGPPPPAGSAPPAMPLPTATQEHHPDRLYLLG